ncbi:hypothetical protein [Parablautia intestinalis]|nr:hypothetical protein [Parablautia intestinalis]
MSFLNDFLNGEELGHEEKFVIATNLLQINGGRKKFLETVERRSIYDIKC